MENSIFIGLSRQVALKAQMSVIANNVANMSTPGFRAQNMVFTEYINKSPRDPKVPVKDDISQVLDYGHFQTSAPGALKQTENPTDVAIVGSGYFGVQTPDGIMYTRAGNFQLNPNGELVTGSGMLVADAGGGTITIPEDATEIRIAEDGMVSSQDGEIAPLMMMEFANIQDLEAMGNGLYRSDVEPTPAIDSRIVQGMLEDSNVKPVLEMTRMIDVLRSYESTQRLLETEHERQRTMIQRLTRNN